MRSIPHKLSARAEHLRVRGGVSIDFSIQPPAGRPLEVTELRVFDAVGRQVLSERDYCFGNENATLSGFGSSNLAMTGGCMLDVSGWTEGAYHCVLVVNGSATLTEKLVILRE